MELKRNAHAFVTDKQTLEDLNLLGKFKMGSMFNLFNRVKTRGGELLLENMFREPLVNVDSINHRTACIRYLQQTGVVLNINWEMTEAASQYLVESRPPTFFSSYFNCYKEKTQEVLYRSVLHQQQQKQIYAVQELLLAASNLLGQLLKKKTSNNPCAALQKQLESVVNAPVLKGFNPKYPYSVRETAQAQYMFRNKFREELWQLLQVIYEFDVYISVATVAAERNMQFGVAQEGPGSALVKAVNLRHPSLNGAVGNNVYLEETSNLVFLTGANMAGKSTWMKTLGVSFYLAHMGFPVAADEMQFRVMDGIFTSINVPDNLEAGWSHFYAEVMRVKHVATEVSNAKRLFVLFDELFKGTNVKDAYDATLAVTQKLSKYYTCMFVISTHIIEVGEALAEMPGIQFWYMPTIMMGTQPYYTYQLTAGITTDRQGMIIIENEHILELLA